MADLLTIAIVFFILALVAAVLGMYGVAGISMDIAKWLVIVFIVLAILSLLFGRGIFLGVGLSFPLIPAALCPG
jgi:uncharacterized membrane protein YtjA (UPF0391 family)